MFSSEFCEIFKKIFFYRTPTVAASECCDLKCCSITNKLFSQKNFITDVWQSPKYVFAVFGPWKSEFIENLVFANNYTFWLEINVPDFFTFCSYFSRIYPFINFSYSLTLLLSYSLKISLYVISNLQKYVFFRFHNVPMVLTDLNAVCIFSEKLKIG